MSSVRVRFAPSPTGALHLGSALTAIANDALARAGEGTLVLRIDDTDAERSRVELVEHIIDTLTWLGIRWHEGPVAQSERLDGVYAPRLEQLLQSCHAYYCFCSAERLEQVAAAQRAGGEPPRYDGTCRSLPADQALSRLAASEPAVVRLAVEHGSEFGFDDLVRGPVAAPSGSFGDFVLRRTDGSFGYQFATVCDDVDLRITHVLRGEDHLSNTPRQLAIYEALGEVPPRFGHLPLLIGASGKKLSKREPLGSLDDLRAEGYLPRSVRRYLTELLGGGAVDPLEQPGAVELASIPASSPHVSVERLVSIGREDLGSMRTSDLRALVDPDDAHGARVEPLLGDLAGEVATLTALKEQLADHLGRPQLMPLAAGEQQLIGELQTVLADYTFDSVESCQQAVARVRAFAQESGEKPGAVLRPLRRWLTGQGGGPQLDRVLLALGADEVNARLAAVANLQLEGDRS